MNHNINQQLAEIRNNLLSITQNHTEKAMTQPTTQTTQSAQPTGKTIVVNTRKGNKSAQVRRLMREQPNLTPKQIADIVGCRPHTVHNVKYNLKKKRRAGKTIQVKPVSKKMPVAVGELAGNWTKEQTQDLLNRASRGRSISELRLSLAGFILDMTFSGNTDLLKNKHFQNVLRITTPSEAGQL